MAAVTCPCCKRSVRNLEHIALIAAHEEEDHRLNAVAHEAADLIAKESMSLYPKPLPPRLRKLKEALENFTKVEAELAEHNYIVQNLITMERELDK